MENKEIVKNLALIGGIIGLLQAIFAFGGWGLGYWGLLLVGNIFLSIIGISAVYLIILGVLMTLFNAWIGGVVVLIAGILWIVWKL